MCEFGIRLSLDRTHAVALIATTLYSLCGGGHASVVFRNTLFYSLTASDVRIRWCFGSDR